MSPPAPPRPDLDDRLMPARPADPRARGRRRPARPLAPAALALSACLPALFAGACTEMGDKGAPPPSATFVPAASLASPPRSADPAPAASASAPPAAGRPLGQRLACARLLPEAARDRLLPGYVLRQAASCPDCGPDCTFTHPSRPYEGVQAAYVCNEAYDAKRAKAFVDPLRTSLRKAGAVKGFGRGGAHGEKEHGTFYTVVAYDDDSDCRVTVDWMRGDRDKALGLAKLALEGVKQTDLR